MNSFKPTPVEIIAMYGTMHARIAQVDVMADRAIARMADTLLTIETWLAQPLPDGHCKAELCTQCLDKGTMACELCESNEQFVACAVACAGPNGTRIT